MNGDIIRHVMNVLFMRNKRKKDIFGEVIRWQGRQKGYDKTDWRFRHEANYQVIFEDMKAL